MDLLITMASTKQRTLMNNVHDLWNYKYSCLFGNTFAVLYTGSFLW